MAFPIELSPELIALAAELQFNPDDVEENFVRGSGHGGQKINKTSSTVQLRHGPTGIEVKVQKHREQSKNRMSAWKLLILKIEERVKGEESKLQQEIYKIKKQKQKRSKRAQEKVLDDKKHAGSVKEQRREAWDQFRNEL